jgi:transcriptional regulator with XRE-family HTH domain
MNDERFMALVAGRIQEIRQGRELTQEDMQSFGFNYRYYQLIESGTANVTLKTLNRLSSAFQTPAVEFLRFDRLSSRQSK